MSDGAPIGVRERNMAERRARILEEARRVIAEQGFDALSTRSLAKAAGVTQPTLYNLIGTKDEIVRALVLEAAARISNQVSSLDMQDAVAFVEQAMATVVGVLGEDEGYYRAAIIAADRSMDLFAAGDDFDEDLSLFVGPKAVAAYRAVCQAQINRGALRDNVDAHALSLALYGGLRANLRDWAYDVISLEDFAARTRAANFLILAADAAPDLRRRLIDKLKEQRA